jgi:hypothetical protein
VALRGGELLVGNFTIMLGDLLKVVSPLIPVPAVADGFCRNLQSPIKFTQDSRHLLLSRVSVVHRPCKASKELMVGIKKMPFQSIPSPFSLTNFNSHYPDRNLPTTGNPKHQVPQD